MNSSPQVWHRRLRDRVAKSLIWAADATRPRDTGRLSEEGTELTRPSFGIHQIAYLPLGERLDLEKAEQGVLASRFSAMDPIWNGRVSPASSMVPLRRHIQELCVTVGRLDDMWSGEASSVFEQLRLAWSVTDVGADTDITQDSYMCGPAADFEAGYSEVAAKHLAGTIVFNLVWTAYEAAVEAVSGISSQPKGALGRDVLKSRFAARDIPGLPEVLHCAVALYPTETKSSKGFDFREALSEGSWCALAAEQLREFRNAAVHGKIKMPVPGDWGVGSTYVADEDPQILRFTAHIRLTLILIQALTILSLDGRKWVLPNEVDAAEYLKTLHMVGPDNYDATLFELD